MREMGAESADPDSDKLAEETTESTDESPDVEEDLVSEELRIDGICGVY